MENQHDNMSQGSGTSLASLIGSTFYLNLFKIKITRVELAVSAINVYHPLLRTFFLSFLQNNLFLMGSLAWINNR